MRAGQMLYLDTDLTSTLKQRAGEISSAHGVDVSMSALAELCIQHAMPKLNGARVAEWVASKGGGKGRPSGGLSAVQRDVLAALQRLQEQHSPGGVYRFAFSDVQLEAGRPTAATFQALRGLVARGQALGDESKELDRFGRPESSFWRITDAGKTAR